MPTECTPALLASLHSDFDRLHWRDTPTQIRTPQGIHPSCCAEALADCDRPDPIACNAPEHLLRRRRVNTPAIVCRQHRKASILAQMQEGDARRTRR